MLTIVLSFVTVQFILREHVFRQGVRFRKALEMDKATAKRYEARTTVERTNSELKDGFLPFKLYRKGEHARFGIELAVLLTTIKKIRHVMQMMTPDRLIQAA